MLAFDDDIEVAATVLSQSERLDENALLASAGSKSQQHLFAIAQRKSLSEAVTDMLVERGDREVVHSMVKNSGARFSDAGFRMLVKRSAGDDDLATVVGLRSDIPHPHFLLLLEKASSAVRARLVAENPEACAATDGVVAEAVGGIRSEARKVSPDFAAAQAEVERRNRIRRIGEAEIYQYACERKFEETAIALSLLCDTPIDVVERALLDPGAEIVLILAKVAGPVINDDQGDPAAARRRSRHVGAGPRTGPVELQPAAARHGPPRARLLPHPRQEARTADSAAGGRRQWLARRWPVSGRPLLSSRNNRAGSASRRRSGSGSSSRRATSNSRRCGAALQRQ